MRRAIVAAALAGLAAAPPLGAQPSVTLTSPEPGQPVLGDVEIAAEVASEQAVRRVTFRLDGKVVGELRQPPYRVMVRIDEAGAEYRFEAVAEDVLGETGSALLISPPLAIDFELELELLQLYVTVTRREERVTELTAQDFVVVDNQETQSLVTFERGDVPITALLLVDASESMRGQRLAAAVAGARAFLSGMAELDQAKLVLFADRVLHDSPFTSFAEVLATGLDGVDARGSTALNDHLYLASKLLAARQGRRVVILLSDGVDVASVLRMRDVARSVRRSQALIYWLRLGSGSSPGGHVSAWRDVDGHAREFELLERAVVESGGRILVLPDVAQTAEAFTEILAELRDQYVLGYYPSDNRDDGAWHEVKVRVRERGLKVRVREGYLDD